MLKIVDLPMTSQGGIWEATYNGVYLCAKMYTNQDEKYRILTDCIQQAKEKIDLEILIETNQTNNETR